MKKQTMIDFKGGGGGHPQKVNQQGFWVVLP